MADAKVKVTKKNVLEAIIKAAEDIPDGTIFEIGEVEASVDDIVNYAEKTIEQLDAKAVKAKETAAKKKAEGDDLLAVVKDALTDEYRTGAEILADIVKKHSGKKDVFTGVEEVTFVFEWYGKNSFAGKHVEGDEMHLALIDVFLKKKGYMEPANYYDLFFNTDVEIPELIYTGVLDSEIINKIQNNDWTQPDAALPTVKEGVVFKRSTLLKGQRRPSVKVKTKWWLEKLHSMYSEEECKILE